MAMWSICDECGGCGLVECEVCYGIGCDDCDEGQVDCPVCDGEGETAADGSDD